MREIPEKTVSTQLQRTGGTIIALRRPCRLARYRRNPKNAVVPNA
jgi:hypothetical protein